MSYQFIDRRAQRIEREDEQARADSKWSWWDLLAIFFASIVIMAVCGGSARDPALEANWRIQWDGQKFMLQHRILLWHWSDIHEFVDYWEAESARISSIICYEKEQKETHQKWVTVTNDPNPNNYRFVFGNPTGTVSPITYPWNVPTNGIVTSVEVFVGTNVWRSEPFTNSIAIPNGTNSFYEAWFFGWETLKEDFKKHIRRLEAQLGVKEI